MHALHLLEKKKHAETLQEGLPTPTVDQSQRGHIPSGPKETRKVKSILMSSLLSSLLSILMP